jgi:hypothetical protein
MPASDTATQLWTWNPYACAALGEFMSVATTVIVSLLRSRLSTEELHHVFGEA